MGNLMLYLLAFRDTLGIDFILPLRLGDIFICLFPIYAIIHKKKTLVDKNAAKISMLLFMYFLISTFTFLILKPVIINNYVYKSLFRCIIMCIFVYSVNYVNIEKFEFNMDKAMKFIIIAIILCNLIQLFGYTLSLGKVIHYNGKIFYGITRMSGTASEPGYLLPVIILPWYYYLKSSNKKFIVILSILGIITFSGAVYAGMIVVLFFILIVQNKRKIEKKKMLYGVISTIILICIFITVFIFNNTVRQYSLLVLEKGFNFVLGRSTDWSGMARSMLKNFAFNSIKKFSALELIFGKGIGAFYTDSYQYYIMGNLYEYGETPHNVYLGILYDSGIVGVLIWVAIIAHTLKLKPETIEMKTIYCGIVTIICHNFIVGGLWIYMLWLEIGILTIMIRKYNLKLNSPKTE